MARKLKKDEEVEAEAPNLKESDASINIEMETKSDMDEAEVEPTLTDVASNHVVQDYNAQCGGALRAKRVEQELTTQAVAQQLRLGNVQIEALEANNFSALPEPTIVKGFIRNYAKLLKMPAEPILAAYAELMPKTKQYAFAVGPGINMKISENTKSSRARYLLLTVLLLLGLAAWFFYQHYIEKPDTSNPMPEVAEMFTEELALQMTMPESALPAIETQVLTDELSAEEEAIEESPVVDVGESDAEVVSAENEAPEVVAEPQNATETASPVKTTRLEFNATQETWLSVVNQSGEEVYNKILYAGNRDIVDIKQPLEIVVGNAHGATLTVDGKPISLAPYTRFNVARVRLGR